MQRVRFRLRLYGSSWSSLLEVTIGRSIDRVRATERACDTQGFEYLFGTAF